jgi:hypothetical protein
MHKSFLNGTPRVYAKNPGSGDRFPRVYAGQIVILHQVFAALFKQMVPAGYGPTAIRRFPFYVSVQHWIDTLSLFFGC